MSPTMLGTVAGQVMGTAGYMAPEQAAGSATIDHRADLFAFGCMFYEMLSGRQPFAGRSVAETLSRIQHDEPAPLGDADPSLPDGPLRIIEKCLAKDPDLRFQHADDMVVDLRRFKAGNVAGSGSPVAAVRVASAAAPARPAVSAPIVVTLVAVAGLAGGWIASSIRGSRIVDPVALTISLPDGLVIPTYTYDDAHSRATLALSPDGERLAFVGLRDGVGKLFLRDLRSYELIEVPDSEQANMPFFSPDGLHVGFIARGKLWRAAIPGGVPVEIGDVTAAAMGATWGTDGTIVYTPSFASALWRISADGGVAEPLTTLDAGVGEGSHRWPQILPDGSGVLFTIKPNTAQSQNEARIAVASLSSGEHEVVLEGASTARYVDGGHLVYPREGRLFAASFDLGTRQVGAPVSVLDGVVASPVTGSSWVDIAPNGTMAWLEGGEVTARTELAWLDDDGAIRPLTNVGDLGAFAISPDGARAILEVPAANDKLWLLEFGEQPLVSRLSTGPGNDTGADWSPDGQWVIFSSDRAGDDYRLYRLPASGGSAAEPLGEGTGFVGRTSVSARAGLLAFGRSQPDAPPDIWVVSINPDGSLAGEPVAVFPSPFNEVTPAFSADGTLLAFVSDESGASEIYVGRYPAVGAKRRVSLDGGRSPLWRTDSNTLLYWNDHSLYSVEITADPALGVGERRLLLEGEDHLDGAYDVTPDGSRLLVATGVGSSWDKTEINVMLNWLPELERRLAAGR